VASARTAVARLTLGALGALTLAACGPGRPKLVAAVEGFHTPESARYDSELDVFLVSNINGNPNAKDNNGFISRVTPFGRVDRLNFITGGRGGVTLHAPKGMAIVGDTLWVADIDVVRAFDRRSGAPFFTLDLAPAGATFLNDVVVGPDGALYVTDTGIHIAEAVTHPGQDRVYRIGAGWAVTVTAEGDTLGWPNGIAWDAAAGRFVVVSYGRATILAWAPGGTPAAIATGPGGFDGIEFVDDDRALVTSWADSSLLELRRDGTLTRFLGGLPAPADLGFDTRRERIAVPLFTTNKVEIWQLR
jgi:sugar lactone lactonase YvrE